MLTVVISASCSPLKYDDIVSKRTRKIIDSGQKFFLSIAKGIKSADEESRVIHLSVPPVSYGSYTERILEEDADEYEGVEFRYPKTYNYPFFRTVGNYFILKKMLKAIIKENKDEEIRVITDALILELSGCIRLLKRKRIPCIACVTDIPSMAYSMFGMSGMRATVNKYYAEKSDNLIKKYDGYIFLTEKMGEVCNPKNKPWILMECLVTPIEKMPKIRLSDKPVVLYAGKLLSDCGVLNLASSAEYLADFCEIRLYGGNSNCKSELAALEEKFANLKIKDVVPLKEIQELEASADLLINPRCNDKEFTDYSFPSKTAEYMMSGTPALVFKLGGIPDEYDDYLYYIAENTPRGIADAIKNTLNFDKAELLNKGDEARQFIISQKNENIQCQRIFEFLKSFK